MPKAFGCTGPSAPPAQTPYRRHSWLWGSGLLLLLAVASLPMGMTAPSVDPPPVNYLTAPVQRGDLRLTLDERGIVDSARNLVVASECEWTTRIIELIPEGTWVEEGTVVVQLDTSELEEELKEREIRLIDFEAKLVQAREVLDMQKLENESGLSAAQLALKLARLDQQKYVKAEFPKQEKEAQAKVALAQEDVSRAQERYKYTNRLVRKGYESPVALEKERLSVLRYENILSNAEREHDLLVEHTHNRTVTELNAAVVQAQHNLDRVEKISEIAIVNRQVQLHTRQKSYDATLALVERYRKSIEACTVRSPATGEIIYANEGSIRNEILEGESIRNRQEIVRFPDLSEMDVKLRIHESKIDGVRQGLPATVRIDAYPGRVLTGRVQSVSRVPTAGRNYNSDLKEYDATVRLDIGGEEWEALKPGLSAQVEILVNRRPNCLSVPGPSVVMVGGRPIVFVKTPSGVEHREVTLGVASDVAVEVVSGLNEYDQVLLSPRTTCSNQLVALQEQFNSETDVSNIGG